MIDVVTETVKEILALIEPLTELEQAAALEVAAVFRAHIQVARNHPELSRQATPASEQSSQGNAESRITGDGTNPLLGGPQWVEGQQERPLLHLKEVNTGREFKIWPDGRIEGFREPCVYSNRTAIWLHTELARLRSHRSRSTSDAQCKHSHG